MRGGEVVKRSFGCVAVALLAVGLSACTSGGPATGSTVAPGPAVLVFEQAGGAMRFADASGRVWGDVPATDLTGSPVWSADGRRVAWLDKAGLHIVDATTARDTAQPCPCNGLARLGDQFATLSSDNSELLLFDGNGTTRRVALNLSTQWAGVGAGGTDDVTVEVVPPDSMGAPRGEDILESVDARGHLRATMAGSALVSYESGFTSPDGRTTAVIDSPSDGACWTIPTVDVLDDHVANPAPQTLFPAHDRNFVQAVLGTMRTITNIDWAGNGIVVTFGPNGCQTQGARRYVTYDLVDGSWRYLRNGASSVGFGADGRSYAIELSDPIGIDPHSPDATVAGTLVSTSKQGARTVLGRRVLSFWATPADQSAGRAVSGPSTVVATDTTDRGTPVDAKYRAVADRIEHALATDDTAALTGLCAQCDPQTLAMLGSASGRAQLLLALRTHPAADDGSVTYPGLAIEECVDGIGAKHPCTPQQLVDIGTLGLPALLELPDGSIEGVAYSAGVAGSVRLALGSNGAVHWAGQSTAALWSSTELLITPTSLGAVHVGMTSTQAQTAAGAEFDGSGDGASYPTSLPTGYPHLYVRANPKVSCFGAQGGTGAQQVVTANGFALGDSVQTLLSKYGPQAHYVTAQAGIDPESGYVVSSSDGDLFFTIDPSGNTINGIIGGYTGADPNSCSG